MKLRMWTLTWTPELDMLKMLSFVETTARHSLQAMLQFIFRKHLAMNSLSWDVFAASKIFLSLSFIGRLAATQYEKPMGSRIGGFCGQRQIKHAAYEFMFVCLFV